MEEKTNILLDRQTLSLQAVINEVEVAVSGKLICKIKGVSLIPSHVRIEPLKIKNNLVKKSSENQTDLQNKIFEGIYYVNVLDYSLGEITFVANIICEKWAENIWKYLISNTENSPEITLTESGIKEQLLKNNPNAFSSFEDLDSFCEKLKIKPTDFVVPAKFSQLEIELETLSARLSSEIFFFRKKLFTELLIQKLESKIFQHEKTETNTVKPKNIEIYRSWKSSMQNEISLVQKYIRSPFIFDDQEQFSNYDSIKEFVPNKELQQDLVSETFYWINEFPKVKNRFERAVELYQKDDDQRDCLDNLRLTLELLIKSILNNNKSLENQLGEIGKYQKELGISSEIRNTFTKLIDYFNNYQNNKVKHDNEINNKHEVEFLFGLTMIFIRMLIKPNNKLRKK
ncbi:hypothetical protein AWE51_25740 [Aquimarina aggregata]|uniref:Uncharacterized protein n=1 Tax=Aquimarina aggregata TaxID=1642818 RepID=A0A162Z243_9FLAO|nr:hypothetical protein [Aquimarina aggregata]KZS39506.1 hypothetical protein AWE51_25740 [Aquimarina aggregata]